MNVKHYLYIGASFVAVATAVNFAVGNIPQLYVSATACNLNALLQKANPLALAGIINVVAVPAP